MPFCLIEPADATDVSCGQIVYSRCSSLRSFLRRFLNSRCTYDDRKKGGKTVFKFKHVHKHDSDIPKGHQINE